MSDNRPTRSAVGGYADISLLARRGLLNLVGVIGSGALSFFLVIVVTRGLGPSGAGHFFEGVAVFSIASNVLLFGADVGLLRWISSDRALDRNVALAQSLTVALAPILVGSLAFAVIGFVLMPQLAGMLAHGADVGELSAYLRIFAIALPFSVAYLAAIAATRGFGTMVPSVFIDKLGKPALQFLLTAMSIMAGMSSIALAMAWTLPIGVGLGLTLSWLGVRVRRMRALPSSRLSRVNRRQALLRFWKFAAPRGLAGTFYVVLLWLDTILLGILRSPREAGIYTASSRYVLLASFVGVAVSQALAPQIGEYLARKETARARNVYRTATSWVMAVAWPIQFSLAIFAPAFLVIFGSAFQEGAAVLTILAIAMVVATGTGPVDWVLLMGGRSKWNLFNTAAALLVNVVLNLLLIPSLGMVGAAIAWGASIAVNNLAPLVEVWRLMRIDPFGRSFRLVAIAVVLIFGVGGLIVRLLFGPSVTSLMVFAIVAATVHLAVVARYRNILQTAPLLTALRFRKTRADTDSSPNHLSVDHESPA